MKRSVMQGMVLMAIWFGILLALSRMTTLPTWLLVIAGIAGVLWVIGDDQRKSDRTREEAERRDDEGEHARGGPEWHRED